MNYALWDGDPELRSLLKPIFTQRPLVVWSLDFHPAPVADLRSILEPLGVYFKEYTRYNACERFCTCDEPRGLLPSIGYFEVGRPDRELYDRILSDRLAASEMARADAFLVTFAIPMVELYTRYYNRSVIVVDTVRMELTLWGDVNRWGQMNDQLRALMQHRWNVVAANSRYDVEYMHYFLGSRPDYVPSFCAYTGAHYHPTLQSFLYSRHRRIGGNWDVAFKERYKALNATFRLDDLNNLKYDDFFELANYLGIVHLPYQVNLNAHFERMCFIFNFYCFKTRTNHKNNKD